MRRLCRKPRDRFGDQRGAAGAGATRSTSRRRQRCRLTSTPSAEPSAPHSPGSTRSNSRPRGDDSLADGAPSSPRIVMARDDSNSARAPGLADCQVSKAAVLVLVVVQRRVRPSIGVRLSLRKASPCVGARIPRARTTSPTSRERSALRAPSYERPERARRSHHADRDRRARFSGPSPRLGARRGHAPCSTQ